MTARPTRSWMFVPGNKERFLAKAAESDADCVFLDLEDGVLPDAKAQARTMVAASATSWTRKAPSSRPAEITSAYSELTMERKAADSCAKPSTRAAWSSRSR